MELQNQVETVDVEYYNACGKSDKIQGKTIFIPTIGTLGDVKPFLILAKQLQKRGHTVRLGVHKRFQDIVKAAGKSAKFVMLTMIMKLCSVGLKVNSFCDEETSLTD